MPLSESYSSIIEHLKAIGPLSSYNITVSNQYDDGVYIDMDNEKPIGRIISFGNRVHIFKIDLTNKIAHVSILCADGPITYQMSDTDVDNVKQMIANALLLPPKCNCICHKPGMTVLHAFPCCGG